MKIKQFKEFIKKYDDMILLKEEVEPGDVLIVYVPENSTPEYMNTVREIVLDILPHNQCLIVAKDHHVEILSLEDDNDV